MIAAEPLETVLDEYGATAAWRRFVACVDPAELERERFRRPSESERPGSAADKRMRRQHQFRVDAFWDVKAKRARADIIAAEADAWFREEAPDHMAIVLDALKHEETRSWAWMS